MSERRTGTLTFIETPLLMVVARVLVWAMTRVVPLAVVVLVAGSLGHLPEARADEGDSPSASEANGYAGQGFIYLDDGSETPDLPPLFPSDTTRTPEAILSAEKEEGASFFILESPTAPLFAPGLKPTALDGLAEQRASVQLGFGRTDGGAPTQSGLGVWLSSEVKVRAPTRFGLLGEAEELIGFKEQSYHVGLGVGYDGFSLGASLHQEQDDFAAAYSGFDLGLAYQGQRWFTNIQFAGYRQEYGPLFYSFLNERKMQAFEVGAGYALWTGRLTFSGRFKYFDYSNPLFSEATTPGDRKSVV